MKNYLYVIHKKEKPNINLIKGAKLIDSLKDFNHTFSNYNTDNIECYTYTNENLILGAKNEDYYFSFSGQLPIENNEIQKNIIEKDDEYTRNYIGQLPGAHTISYLNIPNNELKVFTTITRINNAFYFENDDKIVIGVDPLIVNCFAHDSETPVFDLTKAISFISYGYFTDDNTLFKGVYAVPANAVITVQNNEMTFDEIDDSIQKMFTKNPTDQDYEDLAQAYLDAFEIVPVSDRIHTVGLTGGKDSRLITLGMLEKKIDFKAHTKGFEDHPDVIIAKKIAEKLGLDYGIKKPKTGKENIIVVDIVDKILKAMVGTSGTLYGYENINYDTKYIGNTGITGVGAEIIRGGYGALKKKNSINIGDELVKAFYPLKKYFLPEVRQPYEDYLRAFGEGEKSIKEAQCKHYIFYNVGRRTAGSRIAVLYYSNSVSPFFDNRFIKKATEFNIDVLTSERLHYNLIKKLNEDVANMPLAGSRWEFEANKPVTPDQYTEWIKRQPVYAKTKKGSYNYRQLSNEDNTLREAFKKILLNDSSSEIFSVVDEALLNDLLSKPVRPMLNRFIWSLASIKVYIDYYNNKLDYDLSTLEFKLPGSTEEGVRYPETRDLMNTLRSFNDAVNLEQDKNYINIIVNHESKNNKYVQTGNGGFNIPANTPKGVLSIPERIKKVNVKFYIESPANETDIELYVMQYYEGKKLKSQSKNFSLIDGKILIDYNFSLEDEADNIKFALRFNTSADKLIVKYAFMKLQ